MAEQNTPIGGNMNMHNNVEIDGLVANIMTLTQNTKELAEVIKNLQNNNLIVHKNLINALKDVQKSVSSTSNKQLTGNSNRDKRIARRNGQKYVRRPMNARAADYMFPNPYRKK